MFQTLLEYASVLKEPSLVRAESLFSRLKSSLVRGTRVGIHVTQLPGKSKELAQIRETIVRKNEKLEKLRRQLVVKDRELAKLRADLGTSRAKAQVEGIRPENIIWIFGTAKTGSTWLGSLMGNRKDTMRGASRM
jgi:hypothetical protein